MSHSGPTITGHGFTVTIMVTAGPAGTDTAEAADFDLDGDDFLGTSLPLSNQVLFFGSDTNGSRSFDVRIAGDELVEPNETFTIAFSFDSSAQASVTANGGATLPADLTVTIEDDDAATLTITGPAALTETDADAMSGDYTVTRSGDEFAQSTTVDIVVAHTSTSAADITVPASVTFAAGADTQTFKVTVTGDTVNEAAEMFSLRTAGGSGSNITHAAARDVTLNDDDDITSVTVADASAVSEGASADFTVTMDKASAGVVTVAWTASISDCDSAGVMLPGGNLRIATEATTGAISVRVPSATNCGDNQMGTLTVTLGAVTIASPGRGTVTTSDTAMATVNYITAAHTIGVAAQTVDEGAAMVTVTRAGPALTTDAPITWTVTHDGGTAGADDFNGGLTGTVTFSGSSTSQTITVPIADDSLSEGDETFTLTLSADATVLASNNQIALSPATATITITDGDAITAMSMRVTGPATVNEESSAVYTVDLGAEVTGATAVTVTIAGSGVANPATHYSLSATSLTIAAGARTGTFTLTTTDGGGNGTDDRTLTLTLTATGGANTASMAATTQTITITEDDPVARSARVEAPAAAVAKGVGQLAAGAVVGRLRFNAGAGGNTLTIAGRNMAGDGMETLAAQYLAGGRELSAAELLRQSGFSFTHGDGGRGFNFWGGGSYVSADGEDGGVEYDGDTTAFHVGVDTNWRDGLIGVAIGTSDGDTDFTVTTDGMKSKLETDVVSVHPYLTWRFNNSQIYLTVGHGTGDAELKEPGTVIKTDLTVTTAAFGITHALGEQLAARASALYSRAELDAAEGDGKSLPATDADSTRLTAGLEAAWLAGPWRLFLASDARHDSGDGDTGGALDLGGGVEWKSPTVFVRLEGGGHLLGQDAADESSVSFTARKTSGSVTLGLNLGADATGLDTARLLYGEWRF